MHTSRSTGGDCMESVNTNAQYATSPRTTTSKPLSEAEQRPYTGSAVSAPLLSPSGASSYPTSQAEECPGELSRCGVTGMFARSHFSLSRLNRNQHRAAGGGTKVVHHHVLQPKPTIHRVHHSLGKARRARANVQDQDNDSEASMHHSVHSEDSEDSEDPQ